jgi:acetyl-CoA decarbonylase/synthase complex subunit delta
MEDLYKLLKFKAPEPPCSGSIIKVKIGALKDEGGTRSKVITIGGEKNFPFFSIEEEIKPALALQILDEPINIPKQILTEVGEAINDPIEWAKICVNKFKSELLAIKLISTHPVFGVKSKVKFKETLERIIKVIDVPLIICAPGSDEKDAEVLEEAAKIAKGEKCILASATLTNNYKRIADAARKYDHLVVAETDCDPALQKSLNEHLLDSDLPANQIIIDPTSAALGLGIEYSISIIEQLKQAALKGDKSLQMPIACIRAPICSWSAREAWIEDSRFGSAEDRGILWETVTALSLFIAGANLLVLMNPKALIELKKLFKS